MPLKNYITHYKVLDRISLLFSLLLVLCVFYPLLLPLINNKLEFIYGDFSSIIGTNSAFDFLRQMYYVLNERVDYVDFIIRFLIMGSALSLISTVFTLTVTQVLSAAIAISLILGTYGIYMLVALFETSPSRRAVSVPALTAFYFLNLWSIERIGHIWIWLMYAVLPLYLYLGLSYAHSGGINRLIAYSLLLSAYGIIPHNLIYMAILHSLLVIYIILLSSYKKALTFVTTPSAIYALTNMPIFIVLFSTGNSSYPVHITLDQLYMLSRNGELINFFTFTNNWWPQVPNDFLESPIFKASSISLFLVATAVVVTARTEGRTRLLLHLAYAFILLVAFVAQGTNNPLIATALEHMGKLGVLDLAGPFREWARISILVPPLLTIILAAGIASIKRGKDVLLVLFSLLAAINIVSSPSFIYIYQVWAPAHVPSEYYTLSEEVSPLYKTLWIYPSKATDILGNWRYVWNQDKAINGGTAPGNLERSIGSTYNINLQYAKMLTLVEAPPQLLTALNVKYVILRTDILGAAGFRANYTYLQCQKLTYLTVCQNPHNSMPAYVAQAVVTADMDGDTLYAVFAEAPPRTAVVPQLSNATTIVVHNYKSAWLYQELKKRDYIAAPSRFLYTHNPYKYWSLAYTSDPLHVEWHPYLAEMGIENWQSDYGEGLAFTWAQGARMNVPFSVGQSGEYVLLVRVFESRRGGLLRMYIDGAPAAEVNTTGRLDKFVWRGVGVYRLEAGKHVLTVENVEGFNAVNVVAFVPVDEYRELEREYERAVGNLTIVYLFTASDLFKRGLARNEDGGLVLGAGGEAWQSFDVVTPDYYIAAVKLEGKAVVEIDGVGYIAESRGPRFAYVGPIYLAKGSHSIALRPATSVVATWKFKSLHEVEEWGQYNRVDKFVWDPVDSAMRVAFPAWSVKTLTSPPVPAYAGHTYAISLEVGATHVGKAEVWVMEVGEGGSALNTTRLAVVDVGEGWRRVELTYTPRGHANYLKLQIRYNTSGDDPALWIRDVEVVAHAPLRVYSVWIYPAKASGTVEELLATKRTSADVLEIRRIDPTHWVIKATSEGPFMLVFAQSFDPNWEARVYKDGKLVEVVRPILVDGLINGFWINEVGDLTIELRYVPQERFELGLKISLPAFVITVSYLVWGWRREKGDMWAIRVEKLVKSALPWSRWSR